jgi:hypothetical protein
MIQDPDLITKIRQRMYTPEGASGGMVRDIVDTTLEKYGVQHMNQLPPDALSQLHDVVKQATPDYLPRIIDQVIGEQTPIAPPLKNKERGR